MPIVRMVLPMLMKGKRSSLLFLGLGWYAGSQFGMPDIVQDGLGSLLGQGGDILGNLLGGGTGDGSYGDGGAPQ